MKQNFSILLIISACLNLIFDFMRKSNIEEFHNTAQNNSMALMQTITFVVVAAYFVLFMIHLADRKMWLILVIQIISAVGFFSEGLSYSLATADWKNIDFTVYNLIVKMNFWLIIISAVAFIWTDKGKFSWFTWHGVALAFQTSFATIYVASEGTGLHWLFFSFSFLPGLILIGYFISDHRNIGGI